MSAAPIRPRTPQDHDGLTPLHVAAKYGHPSVVAQLIQAAAEAGDAVAAAAAAEAVRAAEAHAKAVAAAAAAAAAAAKAAEQAAAAAAAATGAEGAAAAPPPKPMAPPVPPPPPPAPSAAQLESLMPLTDPASLLRAKTKQDGHTPLHMAAIAGRGGAAAALLAAAGGPRGGGAKAALAVADKKGRNAAELARRRGHTVGAWVGGRVVGCSGECKDVCLCGVALQITRGGCLCGWMEGGLGGYNHVAWLGSCGSVLDTARPYYCMARTCRAGQKKRSACQR